MRRHRLCLASYPRCAAVPLVCLSYLSFAWVWAGQRAADTRVRQPGCPQNFLIFTGIGVLSGPLLGCDSLVDRRIKGPYTAAPSISIGLPLCAPGVRYKSSKVIPPTCAGVEKSIPVNRTQSLVDSRNHLRRAFRRSRAQIRHWCKSIPCRRQRTVVCSIASSWPRLSHVRTLLGLSVVRTQSQVG